MADANAIYKRVVERSHQKIDDGITQFPQGDTRLLAACVIAEQMCNLTEAITKLAEAVEKLKVE